ncbi:MAG: hypothetical protein PHT07_21115 [Paludibacter sp.]|nr:hypothetical protein [Paludibacter sp.]
METFAQYSLIGVAIIFTSITAIHIRSLFKGKKEHYRDSVGATRLNRDLTARGHKK